MFKMKFYDRLKALRISSSMTQKELSKKIGVSVVTVRNWESGNKSPSMSAIISLAKTFRVSTDYMLGVTPDIETDNALLNLSEKSLILNYRVLDNYGRKVVETLCRLEKQRVTDNSIVTLSESQRPCRYIPKYLMPSAAGFSAPLDGEEFEMMLVDGNVPYDADFAVSIQGDSMFPLIRNGDIVYVKKTSELKNGEVGIFSVDGAAYCKQYYIDNNGNLTLVSANPHYKSTNVFISADSNSEVRCYGKVLLKTKTSLPNYFVK
jgi:phage repressor protein C with HTH and peptisase S24 domain/DNA-binding XRE family transcriptional regulator